MIWFKFAIGMGMFGGLESEMPKKIDHIPDSKSGGKKTILVHLKHKLAVSKLVIRCCHLLFLKTVETFFRTRFSTSLVSMNRLFMNIVTY